MSDNLRIVGAGLPRTGTRSLQVALQRLLGEDCYHMATVFERDYADVPAWHAALAGEQVDWATVFAGCAAAVDWPVSAFWRELADRYPEALVVLSVRDDAATWWRSADRTVWSVLRRENRHEAPADWFTMTDALVARTVGADWDGEPAATAGYEAWNAAVRAACPPERLLEWNAKQGWAPLCERLGLPVPAEPFPRTNTTEEWLGRRVPAGPAADRDPG